MIRQRILLIWEQELVSLEVYCSLAYISLRIPWEEARIPANHTSICSVLVSFIDTAYRSMLVFSTHPDFSPPLNGVLPPELLQGFLVYPKVPKREKEGYSLLE